MEPGIGTVLMRLDFIAQRLVEILAELRKVSVTSDTSLPLLTTVAEVATRAATQGVYVRPL